MRDPKARVRAALLNAAAVDAVSVSRDDLAEVLRELGDLRQVVQQQAKGLRDAGNAALAEQRSMGRVFANAAAASALRENARLRALLTDVLAFPQNATCQHWIDTVRAEMEAVDA